jgi:hypothetical protein
MNNNIINWYDIIKNIYIEKYNFNKELDKLHTLLDTDKISIEDKKFYNDIPIFGQTDRNSIFIKDFYMYYDTNPILKNKYMEFVKKNIKPAFGNEHLVIQKTPNLRVHIPNNSNIGKRKSDPNDSIIGLHYDRELGHPIEELNVIVAITDMYNTNSIYYEPFPNSYLQCNHYNNLQLKKNNYWYGNLNQCKHYNKINLTNKTRISLDFRIIPYSKYKKTQNKSVTFNNKFIIDDYYILI